MPHAPPFYTDGQLFVHKGLKDGGNSFWNAPRITIRDLVGLKKVESDDASVPSDCATMRHVLSYLNEYCAAKQKFSIFAIFRLVASAVSLE